MSEQETDKNKVLKRDVERLYKIHQEKADRKVEVTASLHTTVYWIALFIAILGNIILGIILIPFLLVLSKIQLYLIIIVIAIAFGALINHLLNDIEHLETKHHIIAGVAIPIIAIINIFIMTQASNFLKVSIGITGSSHNPIIISIIYVVSFSLPYIFSRLK